MGCKPSAIGGKTFGNILVLDCVGKRDSSYIWNAKCLLCEKVFQIRSHQAPVRYRGCRTCAAKQAHLRRISPRAKEMVDLRKSGVKVADIAKKFGISRTAVYYVLARWRNRT